MTRADSEAAAREGAIVCTVCGATMNRHAEKVDFGIAPDETTRETDAVFGGAVQEFHTCPGCGYVTERRAG